MTHAQFVRTHCPRPPGIPPNTPDQHRRLRPDEGVFSITAPPIGGAVFGRRGTPVGRYLWVIDPGTIPAILETVPNVDLRYSPAWPSTLT